MIIQLTKEEIKFLQIEEEIDGQAEQLCTLERQFRNYVKVNYDSPCISIQERKIEMHYD